MRIPLLYSKQVVADEEEPPLPPPAVASNGAQTLLLQAPAPGPTVLPGTIAGAVSFITRTSTISLRLSAVIGEAVLDSVRLGTMTGIDIGRTVLEGVLLRAGRDVNTTRGENWAGKSIDALHSSLSLAQLLLSTTFHLSTFSLNSISALAQSSIFTVDSIFGDTESSRAIAAIISLLKREFGEQDGKEVVNVKDVLGGVTWFALVQMRCRRREKELRGKNGRRAERVLWDVVVLKGGGDKKTKDVLPQAEEAKPNEQVEFYSSSEDESDLDGILSDGDSDEETGNKRIKTLLFSRLPPSASISVTTSSTTTRTTTVEVTGTSPPDFLPPKNAIVLSEVSHPDAQLITTGETDAPRYKIVYQTVSRKEKKHKMKRNGGVEEEVVDVEGDVVMDEGDVVMDEGDKIVDVEEWRDATLPTPALLPAPDVPDAEAYQSVPIEFDEKQFLMDADPPVRDVREPIPNARPVIPRSRTFSPTRDKSKNANTANTKRSIVAVLPPAKTPKVSKPKRRESVTPPKEKEKRPGTLRRAWNSNTFLPSTDVPKEKEKEREKEKKKLTNIFSKPPKPPAKDAPRPSGRRSPVMTRMPPDTATTTRTEMVGLQRSSSRTSSYNGDEEKLERTDSYLSMRTRTNMTTRYPQQFGNSHSRPASGDFSNYSAQAAYARSGTNTPRPESPVQNRRSHYAPSIYTLRTTNSQTSLYRDYSSSHFAQNSGFDDATHAGIYPPSHPVLNMAKFVRFASASYGQDFLRLMGIGEAHPKGRFTSTDFHHAEHHAFSHHTRIPIDKIILSSFTDAQLGGTSGYPDGLVPLVHFVCVDDESKAIVVTCRGTLGLEDVLTDMTCDYDDVKIRGQVYRVHKGMLQSALRLVRKSSKLLQVVRDALTEHANYGLVFCGHSLGGGVAAILAILLSEPSGLGFVTANDNTEDSNSACPEERVLIPTGRPVHCYAFGSPACVDTALRLATRRLITSVVHGADIVPSLSIGILRDFQSVALAFKQDSAPEGAKVVEEIRRRVLVNLASRRTWLDEGDDDFLWAVLKTLRASMQNEKLVPPGEVVLVSAEPVFTKEEKDAVGTEAVKVTAKLVSSVEVRFGEVRFGRGMFADHSPKEYESCISMLVRGVCGED